MGIVTFTGMILKKKSICVLIMYYLFVIYAFLQQSQKQFLECICSNEMCQFQMGFASVPDDVANIVTTLYQIILLTFIQAFTR